MMTFGGGGRGGFLDLLVVVAAAPEVLVAAAEVAVVTAGCLDAMVEAGRGREGRVEVAVVGAEVVRA